jgi:hypothetical protein
MEVFIEQQRVLPVWVVVERRVVGESGDLSIGTAAEDIAEPLGDEIGDLLESEALAVSAWRGNGAISVI